jgi:hypothetical protein
MQRSTAIVQEGAAVTDAARTLDPVPLRPSAPPPGAVRSARLRILGVQAALLALGLLLAMLGARQVLLRQLDERIDRELTDQVARLRSLAGVGVDPDTGRPFTGVERLLRVHLTGVTVGRNETVLVLVSGRLYGRSLGSPPVRLEGDHRLVSRWAGVAGPTRGTVHTSAGAVRYAAVPVAVTRADPSRLRGSLDPSRSTGAPFRVPTDRETALRSPGPPRPDPPGRTRPGCSSPPPSATCGGRSWTTR